ncbi:hypothetical protein F5Y11DRAFT_322987 [Daldinia sp. FL1419]|nr:hypothetical protein F5Y11DRAFT_322987 [Daldinia sp. FL1419]
MAIIRDVPGVEVIVQVAGNDAIEYEDPNASERENESAAFPTSTKYIECIDGAEFVVKMRITEVIQWSNKHDAFEFSIRIDGKPIPGTVLRKGITGREVSTGEKKGVKVYVPQTGAWTRQNFRFSAVDVVDDAKRNRIEEDIETAKDLGLIQVCVYRCLYLGYTTVRAHVPITSNKFELAEKSLKGKAISHGTSFSPPGEHVDAPGGIRVKRLDGDNHPIAVFNFQYRSRDALKREMVIPRSPSPSPGPNGQVARMSRAELERLARERLNQLQGDGDIKNERKRVIKRELKEVIDLSDETERPVKFSRLKTRIPEEVIDLTDD